MNETTNPVKGVLRIFLYAGSLVCCLAGLWAIYFIITNFGDIEDSPYVLVLAMIFVFLSFTPAFMLLKGLKTRTRHWALIIIAETIVVALVLGSVVADYVTDV